MSVTALHIYEQLTEAPDERTKAKIIAEAFGQLEERYPPLKEITTHGHIRECEPLLQKEIGRCRSRQLSEAAGARGCGSSDFDRGRHECHILLSSAILGVIARFVALQSMHVKPHGIPFINVFDGPSVPIRPSTRLTVAFPKNFIMLR
jgi:hypothetical protein